MANRWGNNGNSDRLYFLSLQNHCRWWLQPWNRYLLLGRKAMTNLDSILKSRHYFADKGLSSQSYGFSNSQVWMWELDHKERRKHHRRIDALNCGVGEDSWESLGLQGDPTSQSQRKSVLSVIGRTDAEAEIPVLWPCNAKNWLIRKDPDAGKDWRLEEKGMTKDEMVGWHHRHDGREFE